MSQAELQDTLQTYPLFSYVVDFNGDVVAALTSWPLKVPIFTLKLHAYALGVDACFSVLGNPHCSAVQTQYLSANVEGQSGVTNRGHNCEDFTSRELGKDTHEVPNKNVPGEDHKAS